MDNIANAPPLVSTRATPWSASRMTSTLEAFYERRRKLLGDDFPGYYDGSLKRIFSPARSGNYATKAARFLRKNRKLIINGASGWTGQRKYDIHRFMMKLIKRSNALNLHVARPEIETRRPVAQISRPCEEAILR